MKLALPIAALAVLAMSCATNAASRRADVAGARAFFERSVAMGNAHDPAAAALYADEAHVRLVQYAPDGSVKRTVLEGARLKALYPELMAKADPADVSDYDCVYREAPRGRLGREAVFISCLRHAKQRDYWAVAEFLVGLDDRGEWRIYADVTWVCTEASACTKDMPWQKMACAEGKRWREPTHRIDVADCRNGA